MTLVYGQLDCLKRIRETLDRKGITRFNSIGQLNNFIKNYESEKEVLFFKTEQDFDLELDILQAEAFDLKRNYDTIKTNAESKHKERISTLKKKSGKLRSATAKNAFSELGNWYLLQVVLGMKFILEKSYTTIIWLETFRAKKHLKQIFLKVNAYGSNRQSIISARLATALEKLEYTKSVVTDINPLIAGAIGEHSVATELAKLSDTNVLFNDFSLSFNPPIFKKNDNDRIFSIQIDHLLLTAAGIFIIETKNWSKESIRRRDLRSPIKQIQRTSYALYVVLNNNNKFTGNTILKQHHWGNKELPIRNVVAMINHKPNGKFKHVAIKKLEELNSYVNYFEPIFDASEIKRIAEHLRSLKS